MIKNKKNVFAVFLIIGILFFISFISAVYLRSAPQYTQPGFYGGVGRDVLYTQEMCKEAGQDFIIQVAPLGCIPSPVRSDLLEEQNVQVYCPLSATKINPLIDVDAIKQITFSQNYPEGVAHFGFHASKAALGLYQGMNFPVLDNIGYMVVTLGREPNESAMPDFVEGNLTVKVRYDVKNAFGIGRASYYIPELNDQDWQDQYIKYGFWDGRGYVRVEGVEEDGATISLYSDLSQKVSTGLRQQDFVKRKFTSVHLREGEESQKIYLPGLGFCMASLNVRLDKLGAPDQRAKLRINADVIEVARGEEFLEGKCEVKDIDKQGLVQKVKVRCREDERPGTFEFEISPRLRLKIDDQEPKDYELGDILYPVDEGKRNVFLAYIGERKKDGSKFIVPMVSPHHDSEDFLNSIDTEALQTYAGYIEEETRTGIGVADALLKVVEFSYRTLGKAFSSVVKGSDYGTWVDMGQSEEVRFFVLGASGHNIEFISLAGPQDRWEIEKLEGSTQDEKRFKRNYTKAFEDYNVILEGTCSFCILLPDT